MDKLQFDYYYGRESEQFTFYRLPKALITDEKFRGITNNAKLLYGLMLDRMSLSKKRGWLDQENRVYIKYSLTSIESDLNISKKTAGSILKELEQIGLIDIVKQTGVANIIYVKNFIMVEEKLAKQEVQEKTEPVENLHQCKKETSVKITPVQKCNQCNLGGEGSVKITPVPGEFLPPNKIDINTIYNNINQSEPEMDKMDEYRELVKENIEYDIIMSNLQYEDRELYDELYELICEIVCVTQKSVRIGGEDYPYQLVKSKFLKLKLPHLEYVINCVKNNTTQVNNIKLYLITALYNASMTINHYFAAKVNYDMYGEQEDTQNQSGIDLFWMRENGIGGS